ncbi:MAG: hypothetical protein Q7T55_09785 [Solirubrobacteraceae bacterium]|nr:hypothetical protein [Solirubrobacteraceae bacterium]
MIFDENNKAEIECKTCSNNQYDSCPCVIFSGNIKLPNLFNQKFPEKIIKSKPKEDIYKAKL